MTREENLYWLNKEIEGWENECQSKHPIKEALHAARKALEQEPCEDAVSRAEVKKIAKEMYLEVANMELDAKTISDCISCASSKCREVLERKLQALPSVIPQEPRKGHWCPQNDDCFDWYECSECGYGSEGEMQYSSEYDVRTNFCPNCGADMRKDEE